MAGYPHITRPCRVYVRSDNGPEFTGKAIRRWLQRLGVETLFIEPGGPWENGYIESFNGNLRGKLLNREIFTSLTEAKILVEQWIPIVMYYLGFKRLLRKDLIRCWTKTVSKIVTVSKMLASGGEVECRPC